MFNSLRKPRDMTCSNSADESQNQTSHASAGAAALTFRVDDMTCGHCAGTIKKAIESSLPGTHVDADPASKLVSVTGNNDRGMLAGIIAKAGYTPAGIQA